MISGTGDAQRAVLDRRIAALDAVRGAALTGMFIFHFSWDLVFTGFAHFDIAGNMGWIIFARIIAASFLLTSGASFILASRNGMNWPVYIRRLVVLSAAAVAVSGGTFVFLPENWIFFGILHHLAFASALAPALCRLPGWLLCLLVPVAVAVPFFMAAPVFDHGPALFLGLGTQFPETVDYVPLFPWIGAFIGGMAGMNLLVRHSPTGLWHEWRAQSIASRVLCWLGRRTLVLYLTHQLVFLGLLMSLAWLLEPAFPANDETRFMRDCINACTTDNPAIHCHEACTCTVEALKRPALWNKVMRETLTADEAEQVSQLALACRQ